MKRDKPSPAKKDQATTNELSEPLLDLIDGVTIRPAITHIDDRGTVCEILNPAWQFEPSPLVYVYQLTIRPGKIKGWHQHHLHTDRIFISQGAVKVVLYDDRPESPTYRKLNEIYRSEHHRTIMTIPPFVFHAHQNIGATEALLISLPTRPYHHLDPDVYRLPIENDYIPYRFAQKPGW